MPDALGILGLWGVRDWMFDGAVRNIYYLLPSYTTLAPSFPEAVCKLWWLSLASKRSRLDSRFPGKDG